MCDNLLVDNTTSSNKHLLQDLERGTIMVITPYIGVFCTKNVPTENAKSNFLSVFLLIINPKQSDTVQLD